MTRPAVLALALSAVVLLGVAPTVLAGDEPEAGPSEAPADVVPLGEGLPPVGPDAPDGAFEIDPTFVTEPVPATPAGAVLGTVGRPHPTLPPTDASAVRGAGAGAAPAGLPAGLAAPLASLAAVLLLLLLVPVRQGRR